MGGHTVNLLALWQAHGVDRALKERYDAGDMVLAGVSAGGACWYQGCITDRSPLPSLERWSGCCRQLLPPFRRRSGARPAYTEAVAPGDLPGGYGADDGAGVHYGRVAKYFIGEGRQACLQVLLSDLLTASGVLAEPRRCGLTALGTRAQGRAP